MAYGRSAWGFVGLWLVALSACVKPPPPVVVPAPEVTERVDPVSELPLSTLALPLSLDLKLLEPTLTDVLNTELPLRQSDWVRVTGAKANPQVETKMQARVVKLALSMQGNVLTARARVAYWGQARAQLATPFGKAWLSEGTDWGTERQPGIITLSVELTAGLSSAFALATRTKLVDLGFEAPPGGALCGRIVVKVCVPREQAAAEVHAALERELRSAAPTWLAQLDQHLARNPEAAGAVAVALRTLEHPSSSIDGRWLRLRVLQIALGELSGKDAEASMPLELTFRALFGDYEPDAPLEPLPRSEPKGLSSELAFDATLPFARMSEAFSVALKDVDQGGYRVAQLAVLGVSRASGRLLLNLELARDLDELSVYVEVDPELRGDRLSLVRAAFTEASRLPLLRAGLREGELLSALEQRCSISLPEVAKAYLGALTSKLQAPLLLFGGLTLRYAQAPAFSGLRYARGGLAVRVQAPALATLLR